MKTAIQGNPGSFHHIVAERWYGENQELMCMPDFEGVFEAVSSGEADRGVVAVENSLHGQFTEVNHLLSKHGVPIIGEVVEHIHQNLIGLPEADINGIKWVYSQNMALTQVNEFLNENLPKAQRVEYHDTAAAVEFVKDSRDPSIAAIASERAARLYGMQILKPSIEDNPHNMTRFVILEPGGIPPEGANKASLLLQTEEDYPGSLVDALQVFKELQQNMTYVHSRPVTNPIPQADTGKRWRYQFYVDIQTDRQKLQEAIRQLGKNGCTATLLGHYKAATVEYED